MALDTYRPIPWSRAFKDIGEYLSQLTDPNRAVFYTSGRTSNEAAYVYQLFVRASGTNNPRLLQHVPRIEWNWARPDHRDRQGDGFPQGL